MIKTIPELENLETVELHHLAYWGEFGIERYNLKQQEKYYKSMRPDYRIFDLEVLWTSLFGHTKAVNEKPKQILKFVGYKLGQTEANISDFSNNTYTCDLYWTASNCLLLSCKRAGEIPEIKICYYMRDLLEAVVDYAADPLFKEGDLPKTLITAALKFSEWDFEGDDKFFFANEGVNCFEDFLQYALEHKNNQFKVYIFKGRTVWNPLPHQKGNYLFVAKKLADDSAKLTEPLNLHIQTNHGTEYPNFQEDFVFLTPNFELIGGSVEQYRTTITDTTNGMLTEKVYSTRFMLYRAKCVDDQTWKYRADSTLSRNFMMYELTLNALRQEPHIYQDYVIANDDVRDIEFNGCLLGYNIRDEEEVAVTTCIRIFKTRGGSLICHKISQLRTSPEIINQEALITEDHDKIVEFIGLTNCAKPLYRDAGIKATMVVE